jgi:micrococcal nuclease
VIKLVAFAALGVAIISCSSHASEKRSAASTPKREVGTIARVVDGDTIRVTLGGVEKAVRLIGIDTPETHKPGVKVECGGREASAYMTKLAPVGARVALTYDPTQDRVDRYGRLLAYAYANHRSLQLSQIYAGWAKVYVYRHNFQRVDTYRTAAGVAERAHRGVWGQCSGDFHSEQPTS